MPAKSSSRYEDELINEIRKSGAFWNNCFEKSFRAPIGLPAKKLGPLALNWFYITRHFARTLPGLVVLITNELGKHNLTEPEKNKTVARLELLNREVLKILSNDWGIGIPNFDNTNDHKLVHYALFRRMVRRTSLVVEPETDALMLDLETGFNESIEVGFGKLLVVESTASNILRIGDAFSRAVDDRGKKLFSDTDLVYFSLHQKLEEIHADDVRRLIALVADNEERRVDLSKSVRSSIRMFGEFWEKMAKVTFDD